jgi:hypothetical protein
MLHIMVSSLSTLDAGDIRLTIAPVSSKTNCPPLGGVQGVVFQDAQSDNMCILCLYPFGVGTRSEAVQQCASLTDAGATLPWPPIRVRDLGSLSTPHSNAMSLIARIVGMPGETNQVWMTGSRNCPPSECSGFTSGWIGDPQAAPLECPGSAPGCPPWLPDQPSTYVHLHAASACLYYPLSMCYDVCRSVSSATMLDAVVLRLETNDDDGTTSIGLADAASDGTAKIVCQVVKYCAAFSNDD